MTTDRDAARIVRSWLEEGVTKLPDAVLDRVLDEVPSIPQRRPMWPVRRFRHMNMLAKVAAVAAVVAVAIVGLTLRPSDVPGPGTSSQPSGSPSPSLRVVPEAGELAPGDWSFTDVAPFPITFTIPAAGWQKNVAPATIWTYGSEARIGFGLAGAEYYADPCAWRAGTIEPPIGDTVDDVAGALAGLPGVGATAPSPVTLDGHDGRLVELTPPADQSACDDGAMRLYDDRPLEAGRHRYWIVDVDGTTVVISAVDRPGATNRERNALQDIVDSIRFG
jgi:hypothetical protein